MSGFVRVCREETSIVLYIKPTPTCLPITQIYTMVEGDRKRRQGVGGKEHSIGNCHPLGRGVIGRPCE